MIFVAFHQEDESDGPVTARACRIGLGGLHIAPALAAIAAQSAVTEHHQTAQQRRIHHMSKDICKSGHETIDCGGNECCVEFVRGRGKHLW